jgi:adenosylcobinamide kinase / adenosylcobinamide-phosphate guanylyltransferase
MALCPVLSALCFEREGLVSNITFVLGGCRSGKSRYALEAAQSFAAGRRIFIATAVALDDEMRERVARHRAERGKEWVTIEAPLQLPETIETQASQTGNVVLVDCLTFWINNLLLESAELAAEVQKKIPQLVEALASARCPVILVSNEVGAGIVPENRLARSFRDLAGSMNQAVAACATEVVWVVAGIPVPVKSKRNLAL